MGKFLKKIKLSQKLTPNLIQCKIFPELINTSCHIGARRSFYRAWEKIKGPIPKGLFLCHKCDNIYGYCVNIEHIFLGTPKDNAQDCHNKGRTHGKYSEEIRNKKKGKIFSDETKNKISCSVKKHYEDKNSKIKTSITTQKSMYDLQGNVRRKYKNKLNIQNIFLKNNKFHVSASKNFSSSIESTNLKSKLIEFDPEIKFKNPKKEFQIFILKSFNNIDEAVSYKQLLLPIIHEKIL